MCEAFKTFVCSKFSSVRGNKESWTFSSLLYWFCWDLRLDDRKIIFSSWIFHFNLFQSARVEAELVTDEAASVSPTMIYELLLSVLNAMTRDQPDVRIVKPSLVEPPRAVIRQPPCQAIAPLSEDAESDEEAISGNGRRLLATTVARNPYTGLLHPVIRPVYYPISTHYPRPYPTLVYG